MAEYEKKVRSILSENGCFFKRRGKAIMTYGIAHSQNGMSL